MEAIFNIVTVLVLGIIFATLSAVIILPFIAKKKNWKKFNISLKRGVLKVKIEEKNMSFIQGRCDSDRLGY